ncbi:hypothetical protein N7488_004569 [Penicillium malachiteum]|nr:hypothetical protein N7488_004569 [Penicillium malachiteum]
MTPVIPWKYSEVSTVSEWREAKRDKKEIRSSDGKANGWHGLRDQECGRTFLFWGAPAYQELTTSDVMRSLLEGLSAAIVAGIGSSLLSETDRRGDIGLA